jgi:hypothetical protein
VEDATIGVLENKCVSAVEAVAAEGGQPMATEL